MGAAQVKKRAARLGLIVLQEDETIEGDFRRLLPPSARLHISRVASAANVGGESLAAMRRALPRAARLLPSAAEFDAVGYACTSGSAVIGGEVVEKIIARHCRARAVAQPLESTAAACAHLKIKKIALLSPYVDEVAQTLCAALLKLGVEVVARASFNEPAEDKVARIAPEKIAQAAVKLARGKKVDGVFISCTNLQTLDALAEVERRANVSAVSSNQALCWQMCSLAKVKLSHKNFGALLQG